ncbi:MAG: hypothetical protein HYT13_03005 [Candidatus Liptonbacteria bacterium]|nr:hypothetical protein [Candidatus Liptonbacteria bacterium]
MIISSWRRPYERLPVRWIDERNLHVTLVPPWYEGNIEGARMKLERLRGALSPFDISFKTVSWGPDPRRPRLIWATGPTPKELRELKQCVDALYPEHAEVGRPLTLHATLARFREEEGRSMSRPFTPLPHGWNMTVQSVVLYESKLLRGGAEYEILGEVRL